MKAQLYIGTSGWHYDDWRELFYPEEVKGYKELQYHARHFNTVENNSSFYRVAQEGTYKTWDRMTPPGYKFSLKLNRLVTHLHRLELDEAVKQRIEFVVHSTQVLQEKLGAIVIQLPASFRYDLPKLERFLDYFCRQVRDQQYPFDIAIEFRNKYWLVDEVYDLLRRYNVALVAGQSSRYPEARQVTADIAYIRMHGPKELFASKYTTSQLREWATYVTSISSQVNRIYIYFNNDFHGYALENARQLHELLS